MSSLEQSKAAETEVRPPAGGESDEAAVAASKRAIRPRNLRSVVGDGLFTMADVTFGFDGQLLGGIPKRGDSLDYFIATKQMSSDEEADFRKRTREGALTDEEKEQMSEINCCVFEKQWQGYLCVWHGNLKACLREALVCMPYLKGSSARNGGGKWYQKDKKHHKQVGVGIYPDFPVYLYDGAPLTEPHDHVDRVKHLTDRFDNPISAIGRHDRLIGVDLSFRLTWLTDGPFDETILGNALSIAENVGLGACRSQGFGRFVVTRFDVRAVKKGECINLPDGQVIQDAEK